MRRQHERNIAVKCKTQLKIFWKYVNALLKVRNGIGRLDLGGDNITETSEQHS